MRLYEKITAIIAIATAAAVAIQNPAAAASPTTTRVSVGPGAAQASSDSVQAAISADGRYVAFVSSAKELGIGVTKTQHVWLRDRQTGDTRLVSRNASGHPGNGHSSDPAISANGRYIVFASAASNLVASTAQDTNFHVDIFIQDIGSAPPTMRKVSGISTRLQANNDSSEPSVSADGRYVAFTSFATNLVAGDTDHSDVFVRDLTAGTFRRITSAATGVMDVSSSPAISANGRYVAFVSNSGNFTAGDTNELDDVFVRDRQTGTTTRVNVSTAGAQTTGFEHSAQPSISADGRYVAFTSIGASLVAADTNENYDVFVRDRQAGTTTRVSISSAGALGLGRSDHPSISADGRYVAFQSSAANLVAGDGNDADDIFVRDRQASTTARVSVSTAGAGGNRTSAAPSISADGRYVAFDSQATNLVPGDTNGRWDVFVRDRG